MKKQFVLLILVAFISFLIIGCSSPDDKGEISESIIINGESISTTETQLKLDSTKITDADLEQLKYMVNLSDLSISAYSITLPSTKGNISDISALADLTNLTRLI